MMMPKGVSLAYSKQEIAWLEKHKALPISEYTDLFNKNFDRSVDKKNLHALRKRRGWKTGRTGQFEKGHEAWNKGKTGYMGANKTSFKKGQKPHNRKPLGYERVNVDGFVEVKVAEPNKFKIKGRFEWEKKHGEIPKNHVVFYLDGNSLNCDISNLALLSRSELVRLNQQQKILGIKYKEATPEQREALFLMAKIKAKIGEIENA